MDRTVLAACFPWAITLGVLFAIGALLCRLCGARPNVGRLWKLHADQAGSVQSLSLVLTLPFFIMLITLIIQVSQVMIGAVIVHYAAYAAARAAIVWIPADTPDEAPNCVGSGMLAAGLPGDVSPSMSAPTSGGMHYLISPGGAKYAKIVSAATLACLPIAPSRDLGLPSDQETDQNGNFTTIGELANAYQAIAKEAYEANPTIDSRLHNKLAYASAVLSDESGNVSPNTEVQLLFFHSNEEPPLADLNNAVGWQDPITVTVTHCMALLPGPGQTLFSYLNPNPAVNKPAALVKRVIDKAGGKAVMAYRLTAECTLGNQGLPSGHPYVYQ